MQYVDVQGAHVPALGLGTWQLTGRRCRDVVGAAFELGYRHLDTAQTYSNEGEIGAELRRSGIPRSELWITTKIPARDLYAEDAVRSTHDSLKRLGVDFVDLLLIHWPNPDVPLEETIAALTRLVDEGATRYVGVSNFTTDMVHRVRTSAPLLAVQVECHPFLPQPELHAVAVDRNLLFTAYSPLARGKVTSDRTLQAIGGRHGKSAAQVALRWQLQRANTAVIPKAAHSDHLRENLAVFDFELSREEMLRIDAIGREQPVRMIDPPYAPDWGSP